MFLLLGLATISLAAEFKLSQVAPGIYVHQGIQVHIDHLRRDDIANIGFIAGDRCIAVIDSGGSIAIGQKFRSAIKKISPRPICYVINTHVHFDHVLGNFAFKEDHPKFIGHSKLLNAIEANRQFFLKSFAKELAPQPDLAKIIAPDRLVDDQMTIDLGNRKLVLKAHPTAHTNHDLTIFDKKTNTLWLGDLLSVDRIPAIDGSIKGWINIINELLASNYNHIIPGHGPIPDNWRISAETQLRYLNLLVDEIRIHLKKGHTLETAVETVGIREKGNWLLFEENHRRNVTRAFAELEWE